MANWYGTCRSNYFKVKDEQDFLDMIGDFEVEVIRKDDMFGFISTDEYGMIPSRYDGDDPVSLLEVIAAYLAENQVCVIMEAGAEKARYITGLAFAVSWTGKVIRIDLDDIYKKAQEKFGGDAEITQAVY